MKIVKDPEIDEIADILVQGGVAIIRTDTLYGIVACADNPVAVKKLYDIKVRDTAKPCIVLVASPAQMWDQESENAFNDIEWQLPAETSVSVVVPVGADTPTWIHRTSQDVAFRVPKTMFMHELLLRTGPLVAPSANPQGETPAQSIADAVEYFGEDVDVYVDGGIITDATPSQLLRIDRQGKLERLR